MLMMIFCFTRLLADLKYCFTTPDSESLRLKSDAVSFTHDIDHSINSNFVEKETSENLPVFTKFDAEQLFMTSAKIHRKFLQSVDLKIMYNLWVAFFAFFAHMKELKKHKLLSYKSGWFNVGCNLIITVKSFFATSTRSMSTWLYK